MGYLSQLRGDDVPEWIRFIDPRCGRFHHRFHIEGPFVPEVQWNEHLTSGFIPFITGEPPVPRNSPCGLAILTRSKAREARRAIDIPYWSPAKAVVIALLTQMMAWILEMCR